MFTTNVNQMFDEKNFSRRRGKSRGKVKEKKRPLKVKVEIKRGESRDQISRARESHTRSRVYRSVSCKLFSGFRER